VGLQRDFDDEREVFQQQVKTLQKALDRRSASVQRLETSLTQVEDACEEVTMNQNQQLALSPQIIKMKSTILSVTEKKGWLQRPKKNFRKNRWEPCFCKVTADQFLVYMHDNESSAEAPVYELAVRHMLYARAIIPTDMQYAATGEIPRIFQITFSEINRNVGSMMPARKSKTDSMKKGPVKPHVVYPGKIEGENEYGFNDHLFQKEFVRRSMVIGLFKGKKNTFYKCKHCHFECEEKKIKQNDAKEVRECLGKPSFEKYTFLADTDAERDEWVEHLMRLVNRRSEANLAPRLKTPAESPAAAHTNINTEQSSSDDLTRLAFRGALASHDRKVKTAAAAKSGTMPERPTTISLERADASRARSVSGASRSNTPEMVAAKIAQQARTGSVTSQKSSKSGRYSPRTADL